MKKQFDVLVVGELNVDLILNQIDNFPVIGKEVLANEMTLTLGSSSAIFASNLSTLGSKVVFVGKLGNDQFGENIITSLKSRGVETQYINRSIKNNTGATISLSFGEDRANVTYMGAMKYLTIKDVPEELFQKCKHLHVSSIFLQPGLLVDLVSLFQKAKSHGLSTSIDPQWDPSEQWLLDFDNLFTYVDIFMPNIKEFLALTQSNNIEDAIQKSKKHKTILVIKNGKHGNNLWHGEICLHQPAFLNKQVVDTIGAGDSFNAGFIHYYIQQKSLIYCLKFGALTGAINTTRAGGTNAFETMALVKSIAQSTFDFTL